MKNLQIDFSDYKAIIFMVADALNGQATLINRFKQGEYDHDLKLAFYWDANEKAPKTGGEINTWEILEKVLDFKTDLELMYPKIQTHV